MEETDSLLFTCFKETLFFNFFMQTISRYYTKKPYMRAITGSSGKGCVLIIYFNFVAVALRLGFLKVIIAPTQTIILGENLIQ